MKTLRQIHDRFSGLATDGGLTSAQVQASRSSLGANTLTPPAREPLWQRFLEKFDEPIIGILLAAALLSTVVDLFKGGVGLGAGGLVLLAGLLGPGLVLKSLRRWVPSLMLVAAVGLFALSVAGGHPSFEGLAVMIAVMLATGVSFASEYQSDKEFEALNTTRDAIRVKVTREGSFRTINLEEVVAGDLVHLETGDEIPADGRLVTAVELSVDQSLLTGESEPVRKSLCRSDDTETGTEHSGCAFRGTQVVRGTGNLRVTEVGDATMVGQLARSLSQGGEVEEEAGRDDGDHGDQAHAKHERIRDKLAISRRETPLQLKLKGLADLISMAGYVAAIAIFLVVMGRAWADGELSAGLLPFLGALLSALVYAVIIVVVAVPEGLPMSVTVSLALAMRKMTRANSLVRQMVACETIGSATVICSDKTGTLTRNRMTVVGVQAEGLDLEIGKADWKAVARETVVDGTLAPSRPLEWLALNAAANSTAHLEEKEGKQMLVGSGTEGALLRWLGEQGVDYRASRGAHPPLVQWHFSSERKRMATIIRKPGANSPELVVLLKGAGELVLDRCDQQMEADGTIRPMDAANREKWRVRIIDQAAEAMRTIAYACRFIADDDPRNPTDLDTLYARQEELEKGLIFLGFMAIQDPVRDEVPDAVARCAEAGIGVKMVTGDNPETARAIAREIGLIRGENAILWTSHEFNALSDDQVKEQLPRVAVLARAQPLDKLRLVRLLQAQGEVVAVTGDGTNDAPALKRADVGLSMGIAGTEVAKEASKIVLLDDAFSTIVKAVHWGRALYENIQRFIQFQLTINLSALVIAFLGPLYGFRPPFTVLQLLWINVIMDTFAAIALCSEPPAPGLMRHKPKRRDESIVTRGMAVSILSTALFYVVTLIGLLLLMRGDPSQPGWLAGEGPWMGEAAGKVFAVPAGDLVGTDSGWTLGEGGEAVKVHFTLRQTTIFFTAYVLFQVWNLFNCRSLDPRQSALRGVGGNPWFLAILAAIVLGQVLIVNLGGAVFNTVPLGWEWGWIGGATASVLVFAELMRRGRLWLDRRATRQDVTGG
jgi:Ca2+-transporting ATPase